MPLAAALLLSLARPGLAQDSVKKDQVPAQGAATGTMSSLVLPMDPPIALLIWTGSGEDSVMGPFNIVGYFVHRLTADGLPLSVTDGTWVQTASNGDAIWGTTSALHRSTNKPGFISLEGVSIVTGGRGRFSGTVGHSTLRAETEVATGKSSYSYDAMYTSPKTE
jgi:hypothetical protein